MPYTVNEHKHRFSAWAASRAASVKGCRFKVQDGKTIIESAQLNLNLCDAGTLPNPDEFDFRHREWRHSIIIAAAALGYEFTHGVAAKLLNVYLKAAYVCCLNGNTPNPRIDAIHPPIDSVLLDELYARNIGGMKTQWAVARNARWSNLSREQYEGLIFHIREVIPVGGGLWQIEEHWQGYQ